MYMPGRKATGRGARIAGTVLVVVLLMLLVLSAVWPWEVQRQMSVYSDRWNDMSSFREALEDDGYHIRSIMTSPRVLSEREDWFDHLLVVAGVERPYTTEELEAIAHFMDSGGKVLVADDYGYGGPLIRMVGGDVSLNGSRLYSSSYVKNPAFVKATALLDRRYDLLLNLPTALHGSLHGTVIGWTDNRTWMDVNGNEDKDVDEVEGIFYIGMRFTGNIVLSDPSIFINDMFGQEENAAFSMALVRTLLPEGGKVIFDESRHESGDAGERAQGVLYEGLVLLAFDDRAKVAAMVVAIIGVLALIRYIRLPTEWHHRDRLNEPWLLNYKVPDLTADDAVRTRRLVEERVRVSIGLSKEEFRKDRRKVLKKVLEDDLLFRFMTSWTSPSKEDLERILKRLGGWRPSDEVVDSAGDMGGGDAP